MTEDRIYREALALPAAVAEIERCAGTQFDPICVDALLASLRAPGPAQQVRDSMIRIAQRPD
jgi:HD-GYP domain-containing protein (c-di-GMP phosphodiesterase class II)